MGNTYEYYLESVLNSFVGALGLACLCYLHFDLSSLSGVAGDAAGVVNSKEIGSWGSRAETLNGVYHNPDMFTGCAFARQVTVPNEVLGVAGRGLEYGGYMAPLTLENRSSQQGFQVTFMETQASFVDHIIRPWLIKVGYLGLVARGEDSVRCKTVYVNYLARTGSNSRLQVRKTFKFDNVVPATVNGFTNSQTEEGLSYTTVNFLYDKYSVY